MADASGIFPLPAIRRKWLLWLCMLVGMGVNADEPNGVMAETPDVGAAFAATACGGMDVQPGAVCHSLDEVLLKIETATGYSVEMGGAAAAQLVAAAVTLPMPADAADLVGSLEHVAAALGLRNHAMVFDRAAKRVRLVAASAASVDVAAAQGTVAATAGRGSLAPREAGSGSPDQMPDDAQQVDEDIRAVREAYFDRRAELAQSSSLVPEFESLDEEARVEAADAREGYLAGRGQVDPDREVSPGTAYLRGLSDRDLVETRERYQKWKSSGAGTLEMVPLDGMEMVLPSFDVESVSDDYHQRKDDPKDPFADVGGGVTAEDLELTKRDYFDN
jgi:hypothetical protein